MSSAVSSPQEIEAGRVILGAQRFPDFSTHENQPSQAPSHMRGFRPATPDLLGAVGVGVVELDAVGVGVVGENVFQKLRIRVVTSTSAILAGANCALWSLDLNGPCGAAAAAGSLSTKSALERSLELLQSRRGLLWSDQVLALERQLNSLLSDEDELVENGMTISTASLDGLVDFLAAHRPHTHPRLSLTRNGRFAASWSPYNRAKLTLIFTREAADWVGVDLDATTPVRDKGVVLIDSLNGMPLPFRSWIVD